METTPVRKLPIGVQDFDKLREQGYLYVDKTALIYHLINTGEAYFLSRPRRFGKSLLLSTFKAYFEGRKELFEGLSISRLESEWIEYPVMHLSLNAEKYETPEHLEALLELNLTRWEDLYGRNLAASTFSGRFISVLENACRKTGRRVVVLIDEYDKPLLQTFHNKKLQDNYRSTLMAFYTVLKDADPYLKFVFITGVTKFAQVGVFSTLNHLDDISLSMDYTTLCGLTRNEIEITFGPELTLLGKTNGLSYDETMEKLTRQYDGYSFFQIQDEKVFNPFSVLKALKGRTFGNFWFATGTPTFLVSMLQQTNYDLRNLEGIEVSAASLTDYRADYTQPIPVIYQSGYLTIKGYNNEFMLYTLGFPNEEVKYGFLHFVTPFYTPDYIYVFEFKLDGTAEQALTQIDDKGYLVPYTPDGRTLVKVGASFSATDRNIDHWLIG